MSDDHSHYSEPQAHYPGDSHDHPYHLVDPSPLPFLCSMALFATTFGAAMDFHDYAIHFSKDLALHLGKPLMILGMLGIVACMFVWWRTVIREGLLQKAHTFAVQHGLRLGMALFITSEVMFFVAFFWAFFSSAIYPHVFISDAWDVLTGKASWPPAGIHPFNPWDLPFINTLLLLLSGTTVTWAHHALLEGNRRDLIRGLACTVALGLLFTTCQGIEYHDAKFGLKDGIFASTFFLATGFHGVHVIIGTIFLAVNLLRARSGTLTLKGHLGFEFAAWYWHFVDVVWLFLFICVYWWGGQVH